ncbi:helix-turn-helix domain-containing protein [Glaciibacter flavus]|uniref:Helix-turn-helix domain-containing protein n=1 Tax=Orlajensenia flava TaxID=2565934 RepID=A0A4V3WT45_9MICO|nr:helix-turn-helix domain-containing protein [Glaciibacter flavus]THG30567.1 helix-turn-helix domain-containing protein [Glaciibacter flavus]
MTTQTLTEADEIGVAETQSHNEYLTRREAAALCRVPLSTFDTLRRQNRFPFPDAHMGKHMLWRSSTLSGFLEAGGTRGVG